MSCRFVNNCDILKSVQKRLYDKYRRMEEIMKGNFIKKAGAMFLSAAMVVSSIACAPTTTKAAEDYDELVYDTGSAVANTDYTYSFAVKDTQMVYMDLCVPQMVDGMISFTQNSTYVDAVTLTADANTWQYSDYLGVYVYTLTLENPTAADWTAVLNFNTATDYMFMVTQDKPTAVLSNNSITLTKGFSQKLSVSGTTGTITWASSNSKVAKVDSSGKVTAKATGSAKVTATTEDGTVLTCTVSVKKNEYSETRRYASQVPYGNSEVQVYKMSYDKKGNLVLKASLLNNRGYKATNIKKLTITVKNDAGKKVATYTVKNKKISLSSGSSKDFTFTVKKAKLNIKNADLRTATYNPKGTIEYVKY